MRRNELFPQEIVAVASGTPSHVFLTNPSVQYIYRYLTRFVVDSCQRYFRRQPADLQILDWGCGKGHVTLLLRELGVEPVSCDLVSEKDDSSFGQATPLIEQFGIKVVPLKDDVELPFPDASFDAVISMGVLEHVKDDAGSLCEIHRVLRPNGLFFCFFLPSALSWTQRTVRLQGNYYHDRLYLKRKVSAMLRTKKFQILDFWRRQLFPKNEVRYVFPRIWDRLDQFLSERTPLGLLATNMEFVAKKEE